MVPRETPQFRRSLEDILETASDKRAETTQGTRREGGLAGRTRGKARGASPLPRRTSPFENPLFRSKLLMGPAASLTGPDISGPMVVLRCTRKLLRRLRKTPAEDAPTSSTLLGDWYANVLFVYRKPIILAVSARTLLPVLIPARDPASLGPRLAAALAEILAALGIRADQIRDEQQQMAQIAFAPTSSRQILGTMNDFDRMLEPAPGQSLTSAALELAQAPCGPIGMDSPDRATVSLFANPSDTEH